MMKTKLTIAAVVTMLLLSYAFVALPSSSDDVDAAPTGTVYYGYGGSLTPEQLYEYVVEDFGDDLNIPGQGKIDLEDLLERNGMDDDFAEDYLERNNLDGLLRTILIASGYTDVSKASLSIKSEIWGVYKHDSNGYKLTSAVKGVVDFDIDARNLLGDRLLVEEGSFTFLFYRDVELSMDADGDVGSIYTDTSTLIRMNGTTDTGSLDSKVAFGSNSSLEFDEPVDISSMKGYDRSQRVSAVISLTEGFTSNIAGNTDVFIDVSMPVDLTVEFDGEEFEVSERAISNGQVVDIDALFPDLEFDELPEGVSPRHLQRMDGGAADRILGNIDGIRSDIRSELGNIKVDVTFVDGNGMNIRTEKVRVGTVIPDIRYDGSVPNGMTFVGWAPVDSLTYKNTYIAMGDVVMKPVFAVDMGTSFDPDTVEQTLSSGKNVIVRMSVDSTLAVPLAGVDVDTGLIIDVMDGDRKVARWTIIGDTSGCSSHVDVRVVEFDDPEHAIADGIKPILLSFEASGTMPAGTVVTYNVSGTYSDGMTVEAYHIEADGRAVLVGRSTVDGGFVDIPTHAFSDYILQGDRYASGNGGSNTSLIVTGAVAVAVIVASLYLHFRRF